MAIDQMAYNVIVAPTPVAFDEFYFMFSGNGFALGQLPEAVALATAATWDELQLGFQCRTDTNQQSAKL